LALGRRAAERLLASGEVRVIENGKIDRPWSTLAGGGRLGVSNSEP